MGKPKKKKAIWKKFKFYWTDFYKTWLNINDLENISWHQLIIKAILVYLLSVCSKLISA